jgi:peptide/nickel transport system substrate-binding protein
LYNAQTAKYPFDVNRGLALLKEAGWGDPDQNPATPLVALSVKNVAVGTPLTVTYLTTSASQRKQVSEILAESLGQCGIGVNLQYLTQDELYASGPNGPLFGRKFDLAEYAVGASGAEPPCAWFETEQIPTAANHWSGLNLSGYSNADYDALCRKARQSLPGQEDYTASFAQAQSIFANDLPSIPLYLRLKAAVARKDMCNFGLEAYTLNDLWNLEELDYGPACQ